MKRSNLFATVSREETNDANCASDRLAQQAGLIHSYGSGTFGFSTIGNKVLSNIEAIIRNEIDGLAQEIRMNQLQTADLWRESGRWKNFEGEEFFHFTNRDDKDFCLAPTHEEAVVDLVRGQIRSYRDLDLAVYQIGRKYRDDHARHGLIRAKEFIMKDAYSFHANRDRLDSFYKKMLDAYRTIFDRLDLLVHEVKAATGSMGGSDSHEFLAEAEIGSDDYRVCRSCNWATKDTEKICQECGANLEETSGIEVGHLFKLGTRYSEAMELSFDDSNGDSQHVTMGCYGLGVSRIMAALIEQHHDDSGITWNRNVSAFDIAIITARHEDSIMKAAEKLYKQLKDQGFDVVLYDGQMSAGEQFAETDLLGITYKAILGSTFLETGEIELEHRKGDTKTVSTDTLAEAVDM